MKRILRLGIALVSVAVAQTSAPPIEILVGPGKTVSVTLRIDRQSLVEILSTFFGKGQEKAEAEMRKVLGQASDVTLVLTTRKP